MATFDEMQKEYTAQTDRTAAINQQYDAQRQMQLNQLKQTYDQQMSAQQAAQQKIDPMYQQKANDLAVQYERNRRNFNQQAAGNGINTGTGSQAALAMMSAYQRDYGALRTAQADAQAEAQRGMADLEVGYQNQIQNALAQNDYERATALMSEYKDKYNRDLAQAQTLAKYGDFSMYATLYGQEQADNMSRAWIASNPDLAFNTGRISAQEYYAMTGQYPASVAASMAASSGGRGSGLGSSNGDKVGGQGIDPITFDKLLRNPTKRVNGQTVMNVDDATIEKMSEAQLQQLRAAVEEHARVYGKYTKPTGNGSTKKVNQTR